MYLVRSLHLRRSKSIKATDADRSHRHLERTFFEILFCLALLLAVAPRPSSANVLTKMNLRKAGGVASAAGGGGQPFELLLPKEQLNQGDVEVDINLICDAARGNGFKFGIDGSIDVEEGKSVSCCLAVVFNHVICRWGCWLGAPHHQESLCDVYASLDGGTPTTLLHTCHSNSFFSPLVPLIITLLVYNFTGNL